MDTNQGCDGEGDNELRSQEDTPWMTGENKREDRATFPVWAIGWVAVSLWRGNTGRRSHFRLKEKEDCFGFEHNELEEKNWGPEENASCI